jgi:hypothetical protein
MKKHIHSNVSKASFFSDPFLCEIFFFICRIQQFNYAVSSCAFLCFDPV